MPLRCRQFFPLALNPSWSLLQEFRVNRGNEYPHSTPNL
jgi:hypothetical protein